MYQQQQAEPEYDTPTRQTVLLKGSTCADSVSLPDLQQFYTNVQMYGREYAYFQVTHLDFPLNDSLLKTFDTDAIQINIDVIQDVEHAFTQDNGLDGFPPGLNNIIEQEVFRSSDVIPFDLARIHTSGDVANQLNNIIAGLQSSGNADSDEYLWQNWYQNISFDPTTAKMCVILVQPDRLLDYKQMVENRSVEGFVDTFTKIERIRFVISGTHKGQKGELAAAIFGGAVTEDGWAATFDTKYTRWFRIMSEALRDITGDKQILAQSSQLYPIYGQIACRMFVDPYVYIRGTPERAVFLSDGTGTDIMTVQPRNRPPGSITNTIAFLGGQTSSTKTSLQSLRSMMLRFTDSKNRQLMVDEEYVVKIAIDFQR